MPSLPGSPLVPGSVVGVALQDDVILGQDRKDAPLTREKTEAPSLLREKTREAPSLRREQTKEAVVGVSLQDTVVWGKLPMEKAEEKSEEEDDLDDNELEDRDKKLVNAESSKPSYKPSYKTSLKPSYKPSHKPPNKPLYKTHPKKHGTTFSINFPKFKINFNNPFHKRKPFKPKPTNKYPVVKHTYQEPKSSYKPAKTEPAKPYKENTLYETTTRKPFYKPKTYTPVYQQTTTKPPHIPSTTKPSYSPAPEVKTSHKTNTMFSYLPKPLFMMEKPFHSETKEKLPYKPPPVLETYNSGFMMQSTDPLGPSGGPLVHSQVKPISTIWQEDFGDSLEEALDLEERVNRANFPSVSSFTDNFRTTIHWGGPGT